MKISRMILVLFIFCTTIGFAQEEQSSVNITILEDIPRFPNCVDESSNIQKARECFNQEMAKHIVENFNYPKLAKKNKIQGKVIVKFVINSEGNIINVETIAPNGCELLEAEAVRIINLLPKFKPGEQRGEPVNVSYAQPIMFKL